VDQCLLAKLAKAAILLVLAHGLKKTSSGSNRKREVVVFKPALTNHALNTGLDLGNEVE